MDDKHPIVFFDGVCPLCNSFVKFLLKRDKKGIFFVSPLQGESAKLVLSKSEIENLNTVVLYHSGKKWIKSDAVLEIFKRLGWPWRLLSFFTFLPKNFRDWVYQIVAKYRYRLFGKYDTCRLPNSKESERVLK